MHANKQLLAKDNRLFLLNAILPLEASTISSIVAANRTGSAITFRLSVHVAGAGADDKQYLYYDKSVAANDSLTIVIGITLNQTDVLKVYTSAVDMSFNVFGCETTEER